MAAWVPAFLLASSKFKVIKYFISNDRMKSKQAKYYMSYQ